jgi:hypothetical protein
VTTCSDGYHFDSDGDVGGEHHELMAMMMATLLMAKKKTHHVWPSATKYETESPSPSCTSSWWDGY